MAQSATGRQERWLVAGAALVLTVALALFTDLLTTGHPDFARPIDHQKYIYLATHDPFSLHLAPFGWRLLVPTLARVLPFGLQTSFFLITFVSVWLSGVLVHAICRRLGFSATLSAAGMMLFFSMGWATRFNIHDFWLTDATAFLCITAAIWCALAGKDLLFAAVLLVGVTAKESVVFAAPLFYTLNARRAVDWRLAARTVFLAGPAIAVLIALRAAIPALNDDQAYVASLPANMFSPQPYADGLTYDPVDRLVWVIRYRVETFGPRDLSALSVGSWGLLATTLPLFGGRPALHLAGRFLPYLVLVYAQLLYAPVNTTRLVVAAFPAIVALAVAGARRIGERFGTPEWRFVAAPAVLFLVLLAMPYPVMTVPLAYQAPLVAVAYLFLLHLDERLLRRRGALEAGRGAASTRASSPSGT